MVEPFTNLLYLKYSTLARHNRDEQGWPTNERGDKHKFEIKFEIDVAWLDTPCIGCSKFHNFYINTHDDGCNSIANSIVWCNTCFDDQEMEQCLSISQSLDKFLNCFLSHSYEITDGYETDDAEVYDIILINTGLDNIPPLRLTCRVDLEPNEWSTSPTDYFTIKVSNTQLITETNKDSTDSSTIKFTMYY